MLHLAKRGTEEIGAVREGDKFVKGALWAWQGTYYEQTKRSKGIAENYHVYCSAYVEETRNQGSNYTDHGVESSEPANVVKNTPRTRQTCIRRMRPSLTLDSVPIYNNQRKGEEERQVRRT